jgi:predicted glycosyl hydrolase (DUF1957 family)
VEWLSGSMDGRPALIVAPYDAELFGHWWFEGPDWINFLLRKMNYDQQAIKTITVPEYLAIKPAVVDGTNVGGSSYLSHMISAAMALRPGP